MGGDADIVASGADSDCPVVATASIIAGKWTLLMLRDLSRAEACRFSELERSLDGISPRTLSLRLRTLEAHGVVERRTYSEVPPRVDYRLTDQGRDLIPVLDAMARYGELWMSADAPALTTPVA